MDPVSRVRYVQQISGQHDQPRQTQAGTFSELREGYRFPGQTQLQKWKSGAGESEAVQKFGHILRAEHTSAAGFKRIREIGDGSGVKSDDDRYIIGLIVEAVNSRSPGVKRAGLEYMKALLAEPMSAKKRQFVYDSIFNNNINQIGWDMAATVDPQIALEMLMDRLDPVSLLLLHQYGGYPYLDVADVVRKQGLPTGEVSLKQFQAGLDSRLTELAVDHSREPQVGTRRENSEIPHLMGFLHFLTFRIFFEGNELAVTPEMVGSPMPFVRC